MTREEILEYQKALDDFRATPVGSAFFKFKNALIKAHTMDTEDSLTDKDRATTKHAHDNAIKAEKELLALLGAPVALTRITK